MALSDPATEIKHLQRGMSDLVSVLALPAVWSGQGPRQIVTTFHDALLATLNLEFVDTGSNRSEWWAHRIFKLRRHTNHTGCG